MTEPGFPERLRTRIPSLADFLKRASMDRRRFVYDLLPLFPAPRTRDRVARLLASARPRTPVFRPSEAARVWHQHLRTDGITPPLPPLAPGIVADMRAHFEGCRVRDPYRPHLGAFPPGAPPSTESNMGYHGVEDILSAPHVLRLFNDPRLLEAAELYLGCKPTLDNIGCWWSFPDRSAAKGTQRYHRDFDSLRGFKVFFYLTDVDAEAGPHVFMKGSHHSPRLGTGKALADETVRAAFGAGNEVTVTGPAGTWFAADTYGWHKGLLPKRDARLLLTAQYTVNRTPHAPQAPVMERPAGLDPFVNRVYLR
ncbi:hypothetical protein [Azospirillum sp. SYSU D00513]|uniref:hypothetical protein n=1 Tax=Azospirillum sp. SYSU D00513 TaxID=2812561 RepID=UPI00200025B4|nr:hypothetical protein [Azospirillum sp. SYSU D00513]